MPKLSESTFPYFDNQCDMCNHKRHPDGGYCYMFRTVPMGPCGQHTVQTIKAMHTRAQGAIDTLQRMQSEPLRFDGCQGFTWTVDRGKI